MLNGQLKNPSQSPTLNFQTNQSIPKAISLLALLTSLPLGTGVGGGAQGDSDVTNRYTICELNLFGRFSSLNIEVPQGRLSMIS